MSIQLIYSNNFRLPIDRKTAPAPAASRQRDHSPKTKEALKAYDRQKAAGETPTLKSVAKEAGTSDIPSRKAITIRKTEEAAIGSVDLPKSWQEKFDAKVKAFQKSFDLEVQIKAREQNLEWQKEVDFPNYMALLRKVQGMLENKHGVMKRAEFRVIQRCLHPDTGAHVSDANRNEAFRLFMSLEARLVDDDREQADLKRVSTLPRTVEEMMARRRRGGDNRKAQ